MQSEQINELAAALAEVQGKIEHAKKSADNPFFKSKYADLPAVIDAAKAHLKEHGLAVVQITDVSDSGDVFLTTTLMHKSGQWISGKYPVRPSKPNDPQAMGSALTYARRYTFGAIVGVASEEDDDGNKASEPRQTGRVVFQNASLRKSFCENVIASFNEATTPEELSTLAELNKAKFAEMDSSGSEHDKLAVDELRKRFKAAMVRVKQSEAEAQNIKDSYGEGFAKTVDQILAESR